MLIRALITLTIVTSLTACVSTKPVDLTNQIPKVEVGDPMAEHVVEVEMGEFKQELLSKPLQTVIVRSELPIDDFESVAQARKQAREESLYTAVKLVNSDFVMRKNSEQKSETSLLKHSEFRALKDYSVAEIMRVTQVDEQQCFPIMKAKQGKPAAYLLCEMVMSVPVIDE
ncbi:hypothetical protein C2869_17790 [Saccharobesus litoralis]|uniref:Lipoprotein n=1 Tax=Saccharobesus litoralis TaxID=2172099 RepID=A0A2S0VV99_9ALTE|nr:hypothetical protein [Saccharobesus litoralis]AWB68154.1 hypothetical protein C2869_17790 [Saccharobesus litoralis]